MKMRAILFGILALGLTASVGGCQEPKQPLQPTIKSDRQMYEKEDIITLGNLVYVDIYARDYTTQHPLMCGEGKDFPAGKELFFRHLESGESVHAVFPEGITPPKDLDGEFVFHGHFQNIQKLDRYKFKAPERDYRYFVVSSYETHKPSPAIEMKEKKEISRQEALLIAEKAVGG